MKSKTRSIMQIVDEQARRWQLLKQEPKAETVAVSMVTVSREPGSGGRLIAKGLAEKLGLDLFHQEVIHEMAESAHVSTRLLDTLDEKGLNTLENWISSLVDSRHLWPDQYMQHLLKVIGTIGRHGRAVIVGRGANFVLPADKRLAVRIIAARELRIANVSRDFGVSRDEAKRRIMRTEADRRAFVRKYFYADIADPLNYELVINTGNMAMDQAVEVISCALQRHIR